MEHMLICSPLGTREVFQSGGKQGGAFQAQERVQAEQL